MKKEDLQRTAAYHNGMTVETQQKESLLEKFSTWFRNFLESAE